FLAAAGMLPFLGTEALLGTKRLASRADRPPTGADLPPWVMGLQTRGGRFRFDPEGLWIEPGRTLRWLNMGDFHTATSYHPDNADLIGGDLPRRVPEGAESWHSGMLGLDVGSRFEHRFRVAGVDDYSCQPHYGFGMVGRVVVGEAGDGPGTRPLEGVPDAAHESMPSVERIMSPEGRAFEWASRLNGVLWILAEGESAADAAAAVREGVAADAELARHLGAERSGRFGEAVAAFAEGAAAGMDYEEMIVRADRAKDLLRSDD
ncbi:MAG: cupredoxin domain-containing protein, partial [Gemmatimonadota bacterium]